MRITLRGIEKRFGDVVAVRNLDLDIESGQFIALLGPSGCGKTTTLLMLAGIYRPTRGEIRFGDVIVNDVPPRDRNIGMVFQSYALYSHMTVFQNIAYPLRLKGLPKPEIERRVHKVAEMLQIRQLLDRKPGQLSGGQQQRVALGRALVKEPSLLLFDEPLSNLDARLRLTMRAELKRLQRELGVTSIYVTHDQVEAMTMADRVAVMNDATLQAYATPDELYERPSTLFVAGFIGNPPMNLIEATLERAEGRDGSASFVLRRAGLEIPVPDPLGRKALGAAARRDVVFGIRPEHVQVVAGTEAGEGPPVCARVFVVEPLGREDLLDCRIGDLPFHVLAPASPDARRWEAGAEITLRPDVTRLHLFDPETEKSLLLPGDAKRVRPG